MVWTLLPGAALADHPPDPFAEEYEPPQRQGTGTAAGQVRGIVTVGARHLEDVQLEFAGTAELMTFPHLGVRTTIHTATVGLGSEEPTIGGGVGPSLHLLPYRPIDLSAFFEGGVTAVDPFSSVAAMPTVTGGLDFDVSLGPYWYVRLEGLLSWGVFQREGVGESVFSQSARFGIGLQI